MMSEASHTTAVSMFWREGDVRRRGWVRRELEAAAAAAAAAAAVAGGALPSQWQARLHPFTATRRSARCVGQRCPLKLHETGSRLAAAQSTPSAHHGAPSAN
jgi:hypothetical protein